MPTAGPQTPPALLPVITERRSIRAFDAREVPEPVVQRLLEAARWAPSSRNAQPWHFVLAPASDAGAHARAVSTLTGRNVVWAPAAPLLVLVLARTEDEKGRANRHAAYDTGQAVAQMALQATAEGLFVHQMGGFDAGLAREAFAVPPPWEPMTLIAIGWAGDASALPEELRASEDAPRSRRPVSAISSVGRFEG